MHWKGRHFRFMATDKNETEPHTSGKFHLMGDEIPYDENLLLIAESPIKCNVRLLRNGQTLAESQARRFEHAPDGPGAYRLEAWLKVDGEDRIWIYANPIYVR